MNGIIVVDKPSGWTSQDVCAKLRGVLGERRIGHGGTLDPMATGVLPVFCGRATRAAEFCENSEKSYIASMRPGIVTDTQDTTGTVLERHSADITEADILAVLPAFTGEISQLPPMYSAVKVGGKKLYELARVGKTAERKPRSVTIFSLGLLGRDGGDYILEVTCSKGTYIRTLISDIGEKLGCGAAMSALRRTKAGGYSIEEAVPLETLINAPKDELQAYIRPTDSIFRAYPAVTVSGRALRRVMNGNDFASPDTADGRYRVYSDAGEFLMLGECAGGVMKTVKSFFEV